MRKWVFVAGVAVGYVLGARAGRQRYDQIRSAASKVKHNPTVQSAAEALQEQTEYMFGMCREKVMGSKIGTRLFPKEETWKVSNPKPEYWENAGVTTPARANHDRGGAPEF